MKDESFRPNRMLSYFQEEWKILFFVTVSGLIYNLGLLAGPWFEGKMTGKLVDLLGGTGTFHQMLMLVTAYVVQYWHCAGFPLFQTVLCQKICQQRQPAYEADSLRNAGSQKPFRSWKRRVPEIY